MKTNNGDDNLDLSFLDNYKNDYYNFYNDLNQKLLIKNNKGLFKNFIHNLQELKENDMIDNQVFSELLYITCSIFIENEVEKRITRTFNKKLNNFFERI